MKIPLKPQALNVLEDWSPLAIWLSILNSSPKFDLNLSNFELISEIKYREGKPISSIEMKFIKNVWHLVDKRVDLVVVHVQFKHIKLNGSGLDFSTSTTIITMYH